MIVPRPPTFTPTKRGSGSDVKDESITVAGTFDTIWDKHKDTKYSYSLTNSKASELTRSYFDRLPTRINKKTKSKTKCYYY